MALVPFYLAYGKYVTRSVLLKAGTPHLYFMSSFEVAFPI
jgi:hypothetical protein